MSFCTKCGRQLGENEVCTCGQSQDTANTAEAATATSTASKPIITKEQATAISKGLLEYVKAFFKDPVMAAEEATTNNIITAGGLVAVNAVVGIVLHIIRYIVYSAKYSYKYDFGDYMKAIFGTVAWWVAIAVAFAGLIVLAAKLFENEKVDFMGALCTFSVPAVPMLAIQLINFLNIILSHSFFGLVFGIINAGLGVIMIYLSGIVIAKLVGKSSKFIYTLALIAAGLFATNWIVCTAIFHTTFF